MNKTEIKEASSYLKYILILVAFLLGACKSEDAFNSKISIGTGTIYVSPHSIEMIAGETKQLYATETLSDGTKNDVTSNVEWIVDDPDIVRVLIDGKIQGVQQGTTFIHASKGGVLSQNSALIDVKEPTLTSIQITPSVLKLPKSVNHQLTALAYYDNGISLDITSDSIWHSSNSAIASISSSGQLTTFQEGTVTVRANKDGIYSNIANIEVTAATITSIQVTPTLSNIVKGNSQQFTAIASYNDSSTYDITTSATWESTDTSIADFTAKGALKAVAAGSTTIKAEKDGKTSNFVNIVVTEPSLQRIEITPANTVIAKGLTKSLTAIAHYDNGDAADITSLSTWQSTDTSIATITNSGQLLAVSKGKTTIVATKNSISSAPAEVEVTDAIMSSIAVTPISVSLTVGDAEQLTSIATFSDGTQTNVTTTSTWLIDDTSIATVDNNGLVQGAKQGVTSISASIDGITSNIVPIEVSETSTTVLAVCGHVTGTPLDTSLDGGINNTDRNNAAGNCLKVRQFAESGGATYWYTSTPSLTVLMALNYSQYNGSANEGKTYANTRLDYPGGSEDFGLFRQDGDGVVNPGSGDDSQAGKNGQADRWCQKLSEIKFAKREGWRLPTKDKLRALVRANGSTGMHDSHGWPEIENAWTSTISTSEPTKFDTVSIKTSVGSVYRVAPTAYRYVTCMTNDNLPGDGAI